jgi:hypothetical protein
MQIKWIQRRSLGDEPSHPGLLERGLADQAVGNEQGCGCTSLATLTMGTSYTLFTCTVRV